MMNLGFRRRACPKNAQRIGCRNLELCVNYNMWIHEIQVTFAMHWHTKTLHSPLLFILVVFCHFLCTAQEIPWTSGCSNEWRLCFGDGGRFRWCKERGHQCQRHWGFGCSDVLASNRSARQWTSCLAFLGCAVARAVAVGCCGPLSEACAALSILCESDRGKSILAKTVVETCAVPKQCVFSWWRYLKMMFNSYQEFNFQLDSLLLSKTQGFLLVVCWTFLRTTKAHRRSLRIPCAAFTT